MECGVYIELVSEFAEAATGHFAAVSELFAATGLQSNRLSFSQAYKKAKREYDRCNRAHDAIKRHRSMHGCSRNNPGQASN